MTAAVTYSGPDRRAQARLSGEERRAAPRTLQTNGGRLLLLFLLLVVTAAASGFLATAFFEPTTLGELRQGLASLAAAFFVAGGLAYLLRWQLTGEAPVALVGVALLAYGVGAGVFIPVGPALVGQLGSPATSSGLVRLLVSAVAIYLLVRSLSTPVVDSRLRPLRMLLIVLAGMVLVLVAIGAAVRLAGAAAPPAQLDPGLHAVAATGWALAAALLVRRAVDRLQGDVLWIGLALGTMALANALRAAVGTDSPGGMLAAVAMSTLAAGVALFGTTLHLGQILFGQGSERLRLYVDRMAKEMQEQAQRASTEERLHDARSTLAAIRCAAGTLQRYEDRLGATQKQSLQSAVTQELVRLEHLIDPPPPDQLQLFKLEGVLAPVVQTERTRGSEIVLDLRRSSAFARPDDVARIVQNLLSNARRHAPGALVRLSATTRDGFVHIAVADEGPGVSESQREAIFERGRHSNAEGGSGLGLYVARQLALDLGGDLAVRERLGGGAVFTLRLPSSAPQDLADEVGDVAEVVQDKGRRTPVRRQKHGWLPRPVGQPQDVIGGDVRLPVQRDHVDGVVPG